MTRALALAARGSVGLVAIAAACGGVTTGSPAGGIGQACYGNGTCNAGLTCVSNVCTGNSNSGGSSGFGGSSSSNGSSGSSSGAGSGSGSGSSSGAGSGSSSGLNSDSGSSGSDSGAGDDSSTGGWDAAIADGTIEDATFDVAPAPTGLAGFAFVVNGVVQKPMTCTGANWEFPWVPGEAEPGGNQYPPLAGITSVFIVNTSTLPMPYLAQSYWFGNAVPGGLSGQSYQLAGVLDPGMQVDITSVYLPGIVALLGSAVPFSAPDAAYAADEGQIPWPNGVQGSGGATTMYVAEIEVPYQPMSCSGVSHQW
jgi:hypothetical protein